MIAFVETKNIILCRNGKSVGPIVVTWLRGIAVSIALVEIAGGMGGIARRAVHITVASALRPGFVVEIIAPHHVVGTVDADEMVSTTCERVVLDQVHI